MRSFLKVPLLFMLGLSGALFGGQDFDPQSSNYSEFHNFASSAPLPEYPIHETADPNTQNNPQCSLYPVVVTTNSESQFITYFSPQWVENIKSLSTQELIGKVNTFCQVKADSFEQDLFYTNLDSSQTQLNDFGKTIDSMQQVTQSARAPFKEARNESGFLAAVYGVGYAGLACCGYRVRDDGPYLLLALLGATVYAKWISHFKEHWLRLRACRKFLNYSTKQEKHLKFLLKKKQEEQSPFSRIRRFWRRLWSS